MQFPFTWVDFEHEILQIDWQSYCISAFLRVGLQERSWIWIKPEPKIFKSLLRSRCKSDLIKSDLKSNQIWIFDQIRFEELNWIKSSLKIWSNQIWSFISSVSNLNQIWAEDLINSELKILNSLLKSVAIPIYLCSICKWNLAGRSATVLHLSFFEGWTSIFL